MGRRRNRAVRTADRAPVRSEPSRWFVGLMLVGGLGSLLGAGFSLASVFDGPYADLGAAVLGVLSGAFGAYCLYALARLPTVEVRGRSLRIGDRFGVRDYGQMVWSDQTYYDSEGGSGHTLTVMTEGGKAVVQSVVHRNYHTVAQAILQNTRRPTPAELHRVHRGTRLWVATFFTGSAVLMIGLFLHSQSNTPGDVPEEGVPVEATLATAPRTSGSDTKCLTFETAEHSDIEFRIAGDRYKALDRDAAAALAPGQTVTVWADRDDARQKLLRFEEPPFWNKHFGYERVLVRQLHVGGEPLIDAARYAELRRDDRQWRWVFLLFGLLSAGMAVWVLAKAGGGEPARSA